MVVKYESIKGCGLILTTKRQIECITLLMVYDLKEQTMKAATSVDSHEGTMLPSLTFRLWHG